MNDDAKGGCAAIVLLLIILGSILVITPIGCVVNWAYRAADRTISPDAAIDSYEWFEQQHKDIQALELQIKDAEEALVRFKADNGEAKEWAFDQRGDYSRLNNNLTGIRQSRHTLIETYNARAGMITRNLWKSSTLPQHIGE